MTRVANLLFTVGCLVGMCGILSAILVMLLTGDYPPFWMAWLIFGAIVLCFAGLVMLEAASYRSKDQKVAGDDPIVGGFTKMLGRETIYQRQNRELAETRALLERQALEMLPGITAKQPALLAQYEREHAADVAEYSFDCRRHGDFLALFIERSGKRLATTINLGNTREIKLEAGAAPCAKDEVPGWPVSLRNTGPDSGSFAVSLGGNGMYPAPKGYEWRVEQPRPVMRSRELFRISEPNRDGDSVATWYPSHCSVSVEVPGFARPAADDAIYFNGIGARLFAPAGCGAGVQQRILREIEDRYEPREAKG